MTKIFVILVIAAIIESIGVAFLSAGLKEINGAKQITVSEITRVIKVERRMGKSFLASRWRPCFSDACFT